MTTAAYYRFEPSGRCRPYVETIWVQESGPAIRAAPTTILPNGRIELVVHYGDPFVLITKTRQRKLSSCHIVGQNHIALTVKATGRTGVVIARFNPWSAAALLRQPLPEFSDAIVELTDIWPQQQIDALLDGVHAATSPLQRANAVDRFIAGKIDDGQSDAACMAAIRLMNVSWGRDRIDGIAARLGLSRRQLSRRFNASVGTTPKKISQMLRAQKALACIRAGWSAHDIVSICGYTDQAHYIHDMVAHTGRRPSELCKHAGTELQAFFNASEPGEFCGQNYL